MVFAPETINVFLAIADRRRDDFSEGAVYYTVETLAALTGSASTRVGASAGTDSGQLAVFED